MRRGLCIAIAIAASSNARADSPKLEEARKAIESVDYDVAGSLLLEALEEGGNSPAAVTEIYQLSASTAVVLGKPPLARKYFRAWLALDPKAAPPAETAEKFREPFIAAQTYIKEHGVLSLRIGKRDDRSVEILIESDPLNLVAAASLDTNDPSARVRPGADGVIVLPVPAGSKMVRVHVLDRFDNRLVERALATFEERHPDYVQVRDTPFFRRWHVWAISALAVAGAGAYFGHEAANAQEHLDAIVGSPGQFFYTDYTQTVDRRDRDASIANGLFVAAGLCAATAVVMYALRPPATWVLAPKTEGAPGLALVGSF